MSPLSVSDPFEPLLGDVEPGLTAVVVVGAGIAGIACANALAHAGVPVKILEARGRIGGRLHTVELGGGSVDLGGAWIHEPDGNPLTDLARLLGVATVPGDFIPRSVGWDPATGPIPPPVMARVLAQGWDALFEARDDLVASLGPDATLRAALERHLRDRLGQQIAPADEPHVRAMAEIALMQDAGAGLDEMTLGGFPGATLGYGGDYLGAHPIGGYRALLEPLARGLDLRLDTPVLSIAATRDSVAVTTAHGATLVASHVVVSVPVAVLAAGVVAFSPPLDDGRLRAIGAQFTGRFEKQALAFDEPFWTATGVPSLIVLPSDGSPSVDAILGLDESVGIPVLVALAIGDHATVLADPGGPRPAATPLVLDVIAGATGRRLEPSAVASSAWSADPWSRGAYSGPGPHSLPDDARRRAATHAGRVLFAGESTTAERPGYADGAYSTGIRAANRLLGRDEVEVGVLDT